MQSDAAMSELPKRKRKRTRTRKTRLDTDAADAGSEDEEQTAIAGPGTAIEQKTETSTEPSITASRPSTNQTEAGSSNTAAVVADEGQPKKRKRNRKRSGKKGDEEEEEDQANPAEQKTIPPKASAASLPSSLPAASTARLDQELKTNGIPDPTKDASLSYGLKNALTYAYVFQTSRADWKFQKAKEGWLLRHLLTPPQDLTGTATKPIASGEGAATATASEGQAEGIAEETVEDMCIPETYLALVTKYLSTMQGKSQLRLREDLQKTVQEFDALPPLAEAASETTTTTTSVPVKDQEAGAATSDADGKTVSFADMAEEQNAEEDGTAELRRQRQLLEWKGSRARKVLQWLSS